MRNWIKPAGAVALLALAGLILLAQGTPSGPVTEIQMTAKRYEFTPDTIHAKAGELIRLAITAVDHTHGFKLDALHINKKIDKGQTVTVEFTPTEPGTFPFECSHYCGLGHKRMKGQLIVE